MALPTQVTLLASTSAATALGSQVSLNSGAIVNKWNAEVVISNTGTPWQGMQCEQVHTMFMASNDGVSYVMAIPYGQRGNFYYFDTPAAFVQVSLANPSLFTVIVYGVLPSD